MSQPKNENVPSEHGCVARLVQTTSTIYLIGMVFYLTLRLFFGGGFWWLALLNSFAIYTFVPAFLFFLLSLLMRDWRQIIRLGMVCLLGIVWFGPFFQAKQMLPSTINRSSLNVVTLMLDSDRSDQDAMIDWIIANQPDLVLFQNRPAIFDEGIPPLRALLPEQYIHDDSRITLSRYPIIEANQDRVIIRAYENEIAVYNVHFPSPFDREPRIKLPIFDLLTRYDESGQRSEIDQLIAKLNQESAPVIVGGGFNISQHSLLYSHLTLRLRDSFRETNHGLGMTWMANLPLLRSDYIWYYGALRALRSEVGENVGNHHLPYRALIEVRQGAQ
jgi:vancomycin resistance protein VanJ